VGSKTQDDGLVSFKVRAYKLTAYINNHDKPKELAMACDCYACVDTPVKLRALGGINGLWNTMYCAHTSVYRVND